VSGGGKWLEVTPTKKNSAPFLLKKQKINYFYKSQQKKTNVRGFFHFRCDHTPLQTSRHLS